MWDNVTVICNKDTSIRNELKEKKEEKLGKIFAFTIISWVKINFGIQVLIVT